MVDAEPLPAELSFLAGGGEMGGVMRAHDWTATPLGAPEAWPQPLKTTVRLMLNTGHPMFIWWGPELICFYNDAYRALDRPRAPPGDPGHAGARGAGPRSGTSSARRSSR